MRGGGDAAAVASANTVAQASSLQIHSKDACAATLPCLNIRDWPDFARRGVMLDISRGRVPKLETLLDLAEHLADFKINELQLYTEHTFAYRQYRSIWRSWGALTAEEIRKLDARCRELGIDLVPNQNSFGHLRQFLEHPKLKKLAGIARPYECGRRRPSPGSAQTSCHFPPPADDACAESSRHLAVLARAL